MGEIEWTNEWMDQLRRDLETQGNFRCVRCGCDVPWEDGMVDELEDAFHDAEAGDDNGLCSECWMVLDDARTGLVELLAGWMP